MLQSAHLAVQLLGATTISMNPDGSTEQFPIGRLVVRLYWLVLIRSMCVAIFMDNYWWNTEIRSMLSKSIPFFLVGGSQSILFNLHQKYVIFDPKYNLVLFLLSPHSYPPTVSLGLWSPNFKMGAPAFLSTWILWARWFSIRLLGCST